MSGICPSCGAAMKDTKEPFDVNGDEVVGLEHRECPECHEITFSANQLKAVYGYRLAQKQGRKPPA